MDKFANILKKYQEAKNLRSKYTSRWNEISKYVGIKTYRPTDDFQKKETESEDLDKYVEDPTASISVQQSADYLKGIMWGSGEDVFSLVPSDDLLDIADADEVKEWFGYATNRVLDEMNHSDSGFNSALTAYYYDQMAFGTSGIGCYYNSSYGNGVDYNALVFRPYGIDSLCIDEGKNGLINVVFNVNYWDTNRFVAEFSYDKGVFSEKAFAKLPDKVKRAWESKNLNQSFSAVHAVLPNNEYVPTADGVRGCKYSGYWFLEDDNKVFWEENYRERPISVGRMEKIRGEIYGRSSGTMLLSTIRCINEAVSSVMKTMEKMDNPPIGIINSALMGDDVIDTSPNGINVFNAALLNGKPPIFPVHDIGNPEGLVKFLLPYLNEKVATAFKIDILLDFSSSSNMTATESMQRYSIRGKSISGLILQQKIEVFEPIIRRVISLMMEKNLLGVSPEDGNKIDDLKKAGKTNRIIPSSVIQCMKENKPWFKIRFNNEIEKLTKTQKVDDLLKTLNSIAAIGSLYPDIIQAVDWYGMLDDICEAMGTNSLLISKDKFMEQIQAKAQQMAMAGQAAIESQKSQTAVSNAKTLSMIEGGKNNG